jgi:hypothetical protein
MSADTKAVIRSASNRWRSTIQLAALHFLERALTLAPDDAEVRDRYEQTKQAVAELEAKEHRLRRVLMKTPDIPDLWQHMAASLPRPRS